MRIDVNYQVEDIEELFMPESYAGDRARFRRKMRSSFIAWLLIVPVVAGLQVLNLYLSSWNRVYLSSQYRMPAPENPARDFQMDFVAGALPGVLAVLLTCVVVFRMWRKSRWRPKSSEPSPKSKAKRAKVIFWVVFFGLVGTATAAITSSSGAQWHPSRPQLLLLCWGPWFASLLIFVLFSGVLGRWQARKTWFTNQAFSRRTVIELDDWGFKASSELTRSEQNWSTFVRARETASLLVLVGENNFQWVIPKRAFATEEDLEAARALLQNQIAQTTFLVKPAGFSVLPKPVPPTQTPA